MKYAILLNTMEFCQTLKVSLQYTNKDVSANTHYIVLNIIPKSRKLAVISCDGLGYYERRLSLEKGKTSVPSKEIKLIVSMEDIARLTKIIPTKLTGSSILELDDEQITANRYCVRLTLPNGVSAVFHSSINMELPDYASLRSRAERGKKEAPVLQNVSVPIREIMRAGNAFPASCNFTQLFTAVAKGNGLMALLECKEEQYDIRVIFMLNQKEDAA